MLCDDYSDTDSGAITRKGSDRGVRQYVTLTLQRIYTYDVHDSVKVSLHQMTAGQRPKQFNIRCCKETAYCLLNSIIHLFVVGDGH